MSSSARPSSPRGPRCAPCRRRSTRISFFNTLNTIASFTRTDPLRARELLREFSQFYRATLENSGQLIPVKREIAQTLRYLTFEKARFGEDRVLVSVDVDEDAEEVLIPAFVIQPLVENAVRHAMPDEGALKISITVERAGEAAGVHPRGR